MEKKSLNSLKIMISLLDHVANAIVAIVIVASVLKNVKTFSSIAIQIEVLQRDTFSTNTLK